MVRKILPSLAILAFSVGTAQAADDALTARVTAAATKICGPQAVNDGPRSLFYPAMYKAETEACVRLVSRSALAKIAAANNGAEYIALK